tara:strand:+ start:609 stop:1172 length:564 start_codon:yes stop_codon:yes gene_type:complete
MSYKYSKGAQVIGDLKAQDDTQRDTLIDFGEDQIDFQTSGSVRLQANNNGMNLYHDPLDLSNDTGVGEVVKFGVSSGPLTAGKLYFLYSSTWTEVDADSVGSGAECMLGIALGSNPTVDGVLIRGFFDAHSYLSNFSAGKAVYISTTAGGMDTNRPTDAGDFVRIVGYCTTTANVIYFNPSTTWVEL